MELAGQGGGEVKAEAINVHFCDPVAQRIHDELQRLRVADIQGVTGAGVIHVVLAVAIHQTVVSRVINPAEAVGGAHVIAFSGVVVDHIEDDFQASIVEIVHHLLELSHRAFSGIGRCVIPVGSQEAQGVVSPVVA